jgi:hypothetical protein
MKRFCFWFRLLGLVAMCSCAARAHHGLDFLLVQDAFVPAPGKGVLYGGFDWTKDGDSDSYGTEPGFMLGLLPGLAFGMGAVTADVGEGWQIYGVSPYLQMQLLPQEWSKRVRLALRVGYEFSVNPYGYTTLEAVTRTEMIQQTETIQVAAAPVPAAGSGGSSNPGGGGGPDAGPDGIPKPPRRGVRHGGHGHTTAAGGSMSTRVRTTTTTREITTYEAVRREQRIEGFNARLMLETDLTASDRLVLNLVHFNERTQGPAWGYAAGLRHAFNHDLACSVEALGNFNQENWHQAVVAAHYAPVHWGLIKLGAGFGLTNETPDLSLIAGFVVRF